MIRLRENETVIAEVQLHWLNYLITGIWASIGTMALLGAFIQRIKGSPNAMSFSDAMMVFPIFFGPLGYKLLQNWCKSYVLTNTRLYVENGILAKSKRDIPLQKINDVEMSQGVVQRLFGAGHILVLTGNDQPTRLRNIAAPDDFKHRFLEALSSTEAARNLASVAH